MIERLYVANNCLGDESGVLLGQVLGKRCKLATCICVLL